MRRTLVVVAILASAALPVLAAEGGVELSNKAHTLAGASPESPAKNAEAPFRMGRDPLYALLTHEEQERKGVAAACDTNTAALCYDMVDRRVVYRPARRYMPQFDGLRAESISLRHDRIVFKYTFK